MNQKVVLLDGDQRFLQQLIEAFTKGGWHVAATTDGVQALRECRDADLLVTELVLPGMDGIEVIEEMKKSCPAKALVISGIRSQEMMAKVLAKGGDYFLSKPVRAELVCERARMLVEPRKEEPKREEKNVGHFLDERLTNVFLTVGRALSRRLKPTFFKGASAGIIPVFLSLFPADMREKWDE